jgi:hypothetical protein
LNAAMTKPAVPLRPWDNLSPQLVLYRVIVGPRG